MFKLDLFLVPLLALAGLFGPGWLGVYLAADEAGRASVTEVLPDSPAQKAGFRPGDVVLAVGDTKVASVEELVSAVKALQAGTQIKVTVERDGKELVMPVTLAERPADLEIAPPVAETAPRTERVETPKPTSKPKTDKPAAEKADADKPKTGLAPRAQQGGGRPFLGVALEESGSGVQVTEVVDDSPAAKAGLEKGRLVAIGSMKIANLADVDKAMGTLRPGQTVAVKIQEGDETETYEVTLGDSRSGRAPAGGGAGGREAAASRAEKVAAEKAAAEKAEKTEKAAEKAESQAKAQQAREVEREKARAEREAARAEREKARAERAAEQARTGAREAAGRAAPAPKTTEGVEEVQDVGRALREAKGKQPVLLVFGAAWDANSKALKKSLADDAVQKALGGRRVLWVDTDRHGRLADEYGVENLPHMVLLDEAGNRAGTVEGYQPPEILAEKLGAAGTTATRREARKVTTRAAETSDKAKAERAPEKAKDERPKEKKPAAGASPEGERDLQAEIRQLREEIRELRGMLREIMRERR